MRRSPLPQATKRARRIGTAAWPALAVLAVLAVLALGTAAATPPLFDSPESAATGRAPAPPWRVVTLPGQVPPVTRYDVMPLDGRPALRVQAEASYGNLVFDAPGRAAPARLSWSWRVDQANPALDLTRKAGDDAPIKVCLAFDLALEAVPFVERQLLRLARQRSGQHLPAATLCWAWGHAEAVGTVLPNPYTARVRLIVLRQAAQVGSGWLDESRDVAADFRRAFGAEAGPPGAPLPPLLAVIVSGDADNTGGRSTAFLSGLRSLP